MVKAKVSARGLKFPIDLSIPRNDEGFEDAEVELILARIYASKQPFIIIDGFTSALGISTEADELVRVTGFPTSTTSFGEGTVNESYANFFGIYAGEAGKQAYRPWVESCDLILRIGSLYSDVNTYGFSTKTDPIHTIDFHRNSVEIGGTNSFTNAHVKPLLQKILSRLDMSKLPTYAPLPDLGSPRQLLETLPATQSEGIIDQTTFWQRISTFFRSGDIILTETGTPSIGGRDFVLLPQTTFINSGTWLSIGFMLGACQGAALAQRDIIRSITSASTTKKDASGAHVAEAPPGARFSQYTFSGRTIIFIGDGSLQMTVQSISDVIMNKLALTIFIINDNGYTIERFIHGMKATYNDIQPWNYLLTAQYFGADMNEKSYPIVTKRAANYGELWDAVGQKEVQEGKGLPIVEVLMDREDAPDALKKLVAGVARRNNGQAQQAQQQQSLEDVQENGEAFGPERRPSHEKMIKVSA